MNSTEERKRREIEKNNRENNNDKLGKRKYGKWKRGDGIKMKNLLTSTIEEEKMKIWKVWRKNWMKISKKGLPKYKFGKHLNVDEEA